MRSDPQRPVEIRPANASDAEDIARIHVSSWRETYRDVLPTEFLDGLSIPERATQWRERVLDPGPSNLRVWVALIEEAVVGFTGTGRSRDEEVPKGAAEVFTIYVDREAMGTGVGRTLFSHATEALRSHGAPVAFLWVLATNERARRFYEAAGWRADGATKHEDIGGVALHEVRYRVDLREQQ